MLVVGLVAMEIDRGAGLAREVEQEMDLLDAVLAGPLVVGMPPMTSQPRAIASRISCLPFGNERIPSCGNAMSFSSTRSRNSSRSSISARSAVSDGSQTSTCERISPVPWATSQRIAWRARPFTSSWVSDGFRSAHVRIPSMSVPLSL